MALKPWKILNVNRSHQAFDEEQERQWNGPFYFIQGADCQLGLIQRYIEKNPLPGWQKELTLTKLAVEKVNAMNPKPKFFVICGDLCDAFPTTQAELRAKQEADLKAILSEVSPDIPLVCVCGNHDVGDTPTKADIDSYKSSFGDDYFSFWCGGVLCIVVNSQFWADRSLVPDLAETQDVWLEQQLQSLVEHNEKPRALIFQHIPWFLNSPEEPATAYFTICPDIRNIWLPKFKQAGVEAILCGHYHRNAGGWYENLEMITTSAIGAQLGEDSSGMRVVKVHSTGISHQYYALENFPENVTLT